MKNAYFPLLLLLLVGLASCNSFNCLEGKGDVMTKEIDLDLITEIENNTSADVFLSYGPNQRVEVTGHANHIELLNTEVRSKRWAIEFFEAICGDDLSIHITLPRIDAIEIDGSGDVIAKTPFQGKDLYLTVDGSGDLEMDISAEDIRVEVDGSGNVTLSGYAEDLDINSDGSGDVHAEKLEAEEAEVLVDGSGDVHVRVKEKLTAKTRGSGDIHYSGDPKKMDFTENGSGSIIED